MKRPFVRSRHSRHPGFTLVELLVVIGIIAILASVFLISAGTMIKMAKRSRANTMSSQIQAAALAYYTEYGIYPAPYSATAGDYLLTDLPANGPNWGTLICVLCGNVQPYNATAFATSNASITNSRGIAFLSMRSSDVDTNNAPLNPVSTTTNMYFNIAMDTDYDGLLGSTGNTQNQMPNFTKSTLASMDYTGTSTAGVAVWENCNGTTTKDNPGFWVHTY